MSVWLMLQVNWAISSKQIIKKKQSHKPTRNRNIHNVYLKERRSYVFTLLRSPTKPAGTSKNTSGPNQLSGNRSNSVSMRSGTADPNSPAAALHANMFSYSKRQTVCSRSCSQILHIHHFWFSLRKFFLFVETKTLRMKENKETGRRHVTCQL